MATSFVVGQVDEDERALASTAFLEGNESHEPHALPSLGQRHFSVCLHSEASNWCLRPTGSFYRVAASLASSPCTTPQISDNLSESSAPLAS